MKKPMVCASLMVWGAVILLAGASPARADEKVVATVPFEFVVGDIRMPAGDYVVSRMSDHTGVVSVASMVGRHFTFVLTIPASLEEPVPLPALVFERFGNQHYLRRIVLQTGDGCEILLSPSVREQEVGSVARNR